MAHKPLPIGIENFEEMITNRYYYVDKTLFIKELIDKKGKVNLFTRPRRFGKSLNISMLGHFFEKTGKDNASLFQGLKIMDAGEKYTSEMGRYPVIKLTLKAVDEPTFESAMYRLKEELSREFERHDYLLNSQKIGNRKRLQFERIYNQTATTEEFNGSLRLLSECLESHHGEKTIILIDEYDVPLEKAHFKGYYDDMTNVIRSLFGMALKTNDSLNFAVLTGCLRISKESIFTGLNNFKVISITSNVYDEYFGFTQEEVKNALSYYGLGDEMETVRDWYNGYLFGETNVYNPWSLINYLFDAAEGNRKRPEPHWSNTSSNSIVHELITLADDEAKGEIEELIRGGDITKPIHEDIVYNEITNNMDSLWNFLFFTGYLKKTGESVKERVRYYNLKIPNQEVLYIYERKISEWFKERTSLENPNLFLNAILDKDVDTLTLELNKRLQTTISYFDSAEAFYHGFLLGILSNVKGYLVKSNRETGTGRTDIFMKTMGSNYGAVVFEIKVAKKRRDMDVACEDALHQIEQKNYVSELEEEGYQDVTRYGVAFYGKECRIKVC